MANAMGLAVRLAIASAALNFGCTSAESDVDIWPGFPVKQRSHLPIPLLNGDVTVSVGDIKVGYGGHFSIWRGRELLRQDFRVQEGQALLFQYADQWFEVIVRSYEQHYLANDVVYLDFRRVESTPAAPPSPP